MNENNIENCEWKSPEFWTEEFKKAGIEETIGHFDSIISWKVPPRANVGYEEPILKDIFIDNKKTDIYRADFGKNNKEHSIYLHVKE